MKTAAPPQHKPAEREAKGGGARKPFFTPLQARMQVGRPGDRYEVEADQVADRVVAGQGAGQLAQRVTPLTQRQPAEEEEPVQTRGEEEEAVQARAEEQREGLQRQQDDEEEPVQSKGEEEEVVQPRAEEQREGLQRQQDDEEETLQSKGEEEEVVQSRAEEQREGLQRQQDDEEETLQSKGEEEEAVQPRAEEQREGLQRQQDDEEEPIQSKGEEEEAVQPRAEEQRESLQRQSEDEPEPEEEQEEEEALQPQAEQPVAGSSPSAEIARQIRASRGGGNPLPGPVREKMEAQFGAPMDGVRIHTDAPAVLLARALKAQAFTHGNDIFFNQGRFAPDSRSGQHLLAHELTHTIQQGAVQPQAEAQEQDVIRLAPDSAGESYQIRPELLEAIRLARGEIGKVNAKKSDAEGKRVGWQRLREYFHTALGGEVISDRVIEHITTIEKTDSNGKKTRMDALPSWCGIFTWWALKKAGVPIPDWKLGAPGLDSMKQRAPGELPRKGDIVIHLRPYNHFAMVTGVQVSTDENGNPLKMIRVATINGNTAGEDNLGGQVQERWHDLKHWDFVLDPVGKLNLPDVPLVTTSREPDAIEPAVPSGEQPAGQSTAAGTAPSTAERGPTADQVDLDSPVAPPPADLMGGALPEPDLSLPPPADQGPAEEVAEVKKVDLAGSSDQATTAFIDASPSSMAATQPQFGSTVDGKMKGEQQELVNNPPVLEAKTAGSVAVPLGDPSEIAVPGNAELGDGVQGKEPGDLPQASEASPQPFRGNAERERELDNEDSGSFWDRFKNFLRKFTQGIRTSDGSIATGAGERPRIALSAEADPNRMDTPREEGTTTLKGQRDTQVEAFRNNPGQAKIQPRMLDEQYPSQLSAEPKASVDSQNDDQVAAYAAAPLPEDVRANADARISKKLKPNLAEARSQTTQAAGTRDSDKKREIDSKQQAAKQLNADTDTAQRTLVIDNRRKVAGLQGEGMGAAYEEVNSFTRDAGKEQGDARKAIGDHVTSEEGKARTELDNGEKDAEKEKAEGERKAAEKKKELEKEQKKGSWWDRVKSAIKKAVKVITDAIDKVFTAVRKAVKTIIEKAKNAAIGLINKARNWVVDKLNKFRNWAKDKVNKYLKDRFPNLARRINNGIDAVTDTAIKGVNKLADKAIAGINKLAKALAKALDKILATFQTALKTAVRVVGAVLQGDFAEALRAAIEGACEIAGVDPKPVFDFLDRAGKAIMSILKHPVRFIKQLFGAIGAGIGSFFKNIKKHLIQGVIGWLTGALGEINISGPFEFSPRGILSIVLQVLGITYANVKARVIRKVPAAAKVFDLVEKGYVLLKKLVTEGPAALWEEIKSRIASLKETVMGAIRNWLIITAIKEGIVWLLSLTNPASAIVKAVKLLFDLVMFLVERYQQIKAFILEVYGAVAAVASGNFTKVTKAVEGALARAVPVLISLFASVLGLGNIAKQVKNVIGTITKPINKAIDWVVDKVVAFARKIIAKVKGGAKKVKDKAKAAAGKLLNWWKARSGFKDDSGHDHTLSYKGQKTAANLYVASSNPTKIQPFLNDRKQQAKAGGTQYSLAQVQAAETYYKNNVVPAEKKLKAADTGGKAAKQAKNEDANRALADDLQKHLDHLGSTWLSKFFDRNDAKDFPPPKLPVMADNVKARNLEADYLVAGSKKNGYKYKVKTGTESGDHVGNLNGWKELQGARLTSGSAKYVRMHLLPHKLGGDAVDSNLTPARGDLYNTPFSAAVEQPAIQSATEGVEADRKPIWYSFQISYYPASTPPPAAWTPGVPYPADAFPNRIHAEWGFYKAAAGNAKQITRDKASKHKTETPPLPDLAVVPPAINRDGPTALLNAIRKQDPAVTAYFISEILIANRPYSSKTQMKETTWLKFGGERESTRRQYVKATYDAVGTHVTLK